MDKFIKPYLKTVKVSETSNEGTFVLSPLEKGFANTLGNTIRRSLMVAVPGVAIFAVEIKGAVHEFTSLKEVTEDVTEIILNIKDINFSSDIEMIEDEVVKFKLSKVNGTVTAKDITLPAGLNVINPEQIIAHTSKEGALEITFYLRAGRTFRTFEENREIAEELVGKVRGIIPIDSNFSPVIAISYLVKSMNPGAAIEQEKLEMTVKTNGALLPSEAMAVAGNVLTKHFDKLTELDTNIELEEEIFVESVEATSTENKIVDKPITDLDLSVRSFNSLKRVGIDFVSQLTAKSISDIEEIKYLGKKSLDEVVSSIHDSGLLFKGESTDDENVNELISDATFDSEDENSVEAASEELVSEDQVSEEVISEEEVE